MANKKLKLVSDKAIANTIAEALNSIIPAQGRVEIEFKNIKTRKHKSYNLKLDVTLKDLFRTVYYNSVTLEYISIKFVNCQLHDLRINALPDSRVLRNVEFIFVNCDIDVVDLTSYNRNDYYYSFRGCNTVRHMSIGRHMTQTNKVYVDNDTELDDFEDCEFINVSCSYRKSFKFTNCSFIGCALSSINMADSKFTNCRFIDCAGYYPACPETGAYVGYKKAYTKTKNCAIDVIVKLEIPAEALRSSALSRKCRASAAKVLEIRSINGKKKYKTAYSSHDNGFKYVVGGIVEPTEPFDTNRWHECTSGIHHFITREEAINY